MRRVSRRDVEIGYRMDPEVPGPGRRRAGLDHALQMKAFNCLIRKHQVGDVLSAVVVAVRRSHALVRLDGGALARLEDCLDHALGEPVRWLPLPGIQQRVDVFVRRLNAATGSISVSMHTLHREVRYAAFDAGYRSRYRGLEGAFSLLPWQRPGPADNSKKRY